MHDSGLSFRHERYPAYKATREKLTGELQADFDSGMVRIRQVLDASHIPIITLKGYEADDVIGTLAKQGVAAGLNVVVVSGDKDFQQLVRPGVWLLNPGRGGPASVEEQWVSTENGSERLGVAPDRVVDYLALVGDSSDNVPGVKGIGEKGAQELVASYGTLENILAHASELTKKRPREALLAQADMALLSKELVTIRDDLDVTLDLDTMRLSTPDYERLRTLYIELEFHTLAKQIANVAIAAGAAAPASSQETTPIATELTLAPAVAPATHYSTVDTPEAMKAAIARARSAPYIAVDVEAMIDPHGAAEVDPLRSTLVGISIAVAAGEAFYFPLAHRVSIDAGDDQGDLLLGDVALDAAPKNPAQRKSLSQRALQPRSARAWRRPSRELARPRQHRHATAAAVTRGRKTSRRPRATRGTSRWHFAQLESRFAVSTSTR